MKGTLFRQTMFAEFEMLAHRMFEQGEALTAELDELIGNLKAIRDAVDKGEEAELRELLRKAGDIKRQAG